jgi:hypothetical protein
MIKRLTSACVVATMFSTACLAEAKDGIFTSPDKRITYAAPHDGPVIPYYVIRKKMPIIYSNIATKYPKSPFYPYDGYTVAGPNTIVGFSELAVAFTPASNATVSEIDAAVGNIGGTNGVVMSIYSDASGAPGASLADFNVGNLPVFGACCELAIAKAGKGVKLTAGTQYWLVFATGKKQTDAWDAVSMQTTDQLSPIPVAGNLGQGWKVQSTTVAPAFGIFGD